MSCQLVYYWWTTLKLKFTLLQISPHTNNIKGNFNLSSQMESMFNFDLIRDTITISKDIMTRLMGKYLIHHII